MNRNLNEITDEMLACYLEGKLTAAEKAAVEQYLSEHQEALDAVVLARYELGYKRAKRRFCGWAVLAFVLLGCLALLLWRLLTPIQMKVNVMEDADRAIPALPFAGGTLQCQYACNALQRLAVTPDSPTVFLNDIPYRLKGNPVHLVFEAEGYQTIDTVVKAQPSVTLCIQRNNDLGVVFGRVCDFENGQPVEGASVCLLGFTALTDGQGQFRIEIPYDQQNDVQRVLITKEGYRPWDALYRPSSTVPWLISLEKEERP